MLNPFFQDLEFGGVGLFGAHSDQNTGGTERQQLGSHRQEDQEVERVPPPRTMQSMRGAGDIYDMAAYAQAGNGEDRPRRPFRGRQRVRGGEGFRRVESRIGEGEEERPVIPLNRADPGLATIDRR